MIHLYITRHGQTEFNVARKMQGQNNSNLTALGKQAAQELGNAFQDIALDCIYCSPLGRTKETLEAFLSTYQKPVTIIYEDRIKEINFGTWEGQNFDQLQIDQKEVMQVYLYNPVAYRSVSGGESYLDVEARVSKLIDEIKLKHDGQRVLLICHGIVMRVLLRYLSGRDWNTLRTCKHPYGCSLTHFTIEKNSVALIKECDITHLSVPTE